MVFRSVSSRFPVLRTALVSAIALSVVAQGVFAPADAMVRMTKEGIYQSLRYGMQNSGLGLYNLLGPNWIEGADGALLNIYTPFMLLASKASRGGFPNDPTADDLKAAKRRYARTIRNFNSIQDKQLVKFSVSMYGDTPNFAYKSIAHIEGIGRGKRFDIQPEKSIRQKYAKEVPGAEYKPYEAINAYYFKFEQLDNMDDFKLIIENVDNPKAAPIMFRIMGGKIL